MGWASLTHGKDEKYTNYWPENLNGRNYLEDTGGEGYNIKMHL
jgi:hypothetical protein